MLNVLSKYDVKNVYIKNKISLLKLFNPSYYKRSDILWSEFLSYHTLIMYLMNKRYKRKFIIHIHGSETRYEGLLKPIMKRILKNKTTIIVPSIYIKKQVQKKFGVDSFVVRNPLPDINQLFGRKYSLLMASHTQNKRIIETINQFRERYIDPNHYLLIISPYGDKKYLKEVQEHILKIEDTRIELVNYNFNSIEEGIALFALMNNCAEAILLSEEEGMNVFLTEVKLLKKKVWSSNIPPNKELTDLSVEEFKFKNISETIDKIILKR